MVRKMEMILLFFVYMNKKNANIVGKTPIIINCRKYRGEKNRAQGIISKELKTNLVEEKGISKERR